jgi:hypothetical protein
MRWFRRTPNSPEELAQVKAEIEQLRAAMAQHDIRTGALTGGIDLQPDQPDRPDRPDQPDRPALQRRIDALDLSSAGRTDGELSARLDTMAEQLNTLDTRITSISRELANQISELGGDIDALQKRAQDEPVADEVIEEVRDAQERLASEQARYQIAFRQDLARLAEQLKRNARP